MIRLVFSDLRDHAPTWVGALLVAVGCGFIGGWAASFQQTALFYSGTLHWYLQNAVTVLLLFSIPVALIVLTSASSLTVSVQRRSYALWQLALREPEPERKGMTWVRLLLFIGAVACVIWLHATMVRLMAEDSTSWANFTSWALPIPVLVSAALAAVAPPLMSGVLLAWSALIPQRRLSAWYLARHTASHSLTASTSTETPIMVGFGAVAGLCSLLGAFGTYAQTHISAQTGSWTLDLTTGIILLGGPVIMCAIGASTSVLMSAGRRGHDVALLIAAGARRSTLLAAAVCEALIHVVTATLVGMLGVVVSCAIIAAALGLPPAAGVALAPGLIVSAVGFALVLLTTLAPTLRALNKEAAAELAAQQ